MQQLNTLELTPCPKSTTPMGSQEISSLLEQLPEWTPGTSNGENQITRTFKFPDFARALAFTQAAGELAEAENHHPVMVTEWGKVTLTWWTHSIGGLHTNDFIMAARCDVLYQNRQN